MILKIFSSNLDKKKLTFLILLIIIFALVLLFIKDQLSINKLFKNLEKNTGIKTELHNNQKWSYYPEFSYQNNLSIYGRDGNLIIENSSINITRKYEIISPFEIKYQSPSILYKGVNFKNTNIESQYSNNIINIKKFSANLIDGSLDISGFLHTNHNEQIALNGSFNNISINRILKQLQITNWERVKINLSSSDFSLNSINGSLEKIINNSDGKMNITGSIFFVSKEEERFGAAFLSLIADKFVNMKSLSQSINYLLGKFADIPSTLSGQIIIKKGILKTEKLLIKNKKGKALLTASLNLQSNEIDGNIDLYDNDVIFLTVGLKGDLRNPEILVGKDTFSTDKNKKSQNIKTIFEEGIRSLIDDYLKLND